MKHSMEYRVPYADTDQMGVVYYANYLEYFERSRTEMLRSIGLPYSELEKMGFFLPVSEAYCKYHSSAHYDELLTFSSWAKEAKGVRLVVASEVRFGEKVLATGFVTLACVNREQKLSRLPALLIEKCAALTEPGEEQK